MSSPELTNTIRTLIKQESLPDSYADTVKKTILPLAQHLHSLKQARNEPIVIGIHGAQGTGKSTLTLFLPCRAGAASKRNPPAVHYPGRSRHP